MPLFLINARDKADALDTRLATRAEHLAYIAEAKVKILMAGPVFLEDGTTMAGSTFVIDCAEAETARNWAANDPYAKAGLFETVEIVPFKWLIGTAKPSPDQP